MPEQEPIYQIHNVIRRFHTRAARRQASKRSRTNLGLAGGTIRCSPGRYVNVTESVVRRIQAELLKSEANGEIILTDQTKRRVNIATLEVTGAPMTFAPMPSPPMDSIKNDNQYQIGNEFPVVEGGKTISQPIDRPSVFGDLEEDGIAEEASLEGEPESPPQETEVIEVDEQDLMDTNPPVDESTGDEEQLTKLAEDPTFIPVLEQEPMEDLERLTAPEAQPETEKMEVMGPLPPTEKKKAEKAEKHRKK